MRHRTIRMRCKAGLCSNVRRPSQDAPTPQRAGGVVALRVAVPCRARFVAGLAKGSPFAASGFARSSAGHLQRMLLSLLK